MCTVSSVCSVPIEVSSSTNTSKKLSAGKSTPGLCCLIWPSDGLDGDSRMCTGPNTDDVPSSSIATISVSMVERPPGPQPTQGLARCTVDGPDRFTVSVPTPVMLTTTCALVLMVSLPAGGNVHTGVG